MTLQRGFVAEFTPVVVDQTLAPKDKAWAWQKFKTGFTLSFDDQRWTPVRTWEQSQAMSCGIKFLDENGAPLRGLPVDIGWDGGPDIAPTVTNGDGWIDVPISGGQYPEGSRGPMWIRLLDGSLTYDGIGWPFVTNHDHLNLDVKRGPAPDRPVPPDPPPSNGDEQARLAFIHRRAEDASRALAQAQKAIEDIVAASN